MVRAENRYIVQLGGCGGGVTEKIRIESLLRVVIAFWATQPPARVQRWIVARIHEAGTCFSL